MQTCLELLRRIFNFQKPLKKVVKKKERATHSFQRWSESAAHAQYAARRSVGGEKAAVLWCQTQAKQNNISASFFLLNMSNDCIFLSYITANEWPALHGIGSQFHLTFLCEQKIRNDVSL